MLIDLNFPGEMSLKQMHALKSNRLVLSSPIHFGMVFERIVNEISSFKTLGLQRENSKIRFLVRLPLSLSQAAACNDKIYQMSPEGDN